MEGKKRLDQSSRSVLENSQFLNSQTQIDRNAELQKFQEELQKYEKNQNNNQQKNNRRNQYHFNLSGQALENNEDQNIILTRDNNSILTFGENPKNSFSSSRRFDNDTSLERSQKNINQEALSFENSNILNSSHLDLTSSITIRKENNLFTKCQYVAFCNNYGDNSCYVNVVLHLLYNITDLNNIFKDLYEIGEIQKQNPKENLNTNNNTQTTNANINPNIREITDANDNTINTNVNNNTKNTIENNNSVKENLTQSNDKPLDINDLFMEIGEILSNYEIYLDSSNTVQQVTIIDTKKMRTCLEKVSNGLFPLNYVADPVELLIYILDNLNINYQREIHNNFHMELVDKVVCLKKCPNTSKNNFDKDNFLYHIYIEELLNYIKDNAIKFKNSKGDLFHLSYSLYTDDKKECQKCSLLMDKFLLCFNIPKYLIINCVWKNAIPEINDIRDFLFLLSLEDDLNNLFICQISRKFSDTKYHLLGMILYSYTLCHYTVLIFNRKERIFTLYNDDTVKEFKTLYDVFPEMLINNVNLYDNEKGYFYPVMIIYTKEDIYNRNDIKINTLDEKEYVTLINQIEENQKIFTEKHTLTEEQKKKNLEELIEKQKIYDQDQMNKKNNINKNSNNIIHNIDNNIDNNMNIEVNENKDNLNLGPNNNNQNDWINYNFEDDNNKNQNQIIDNSKNNNINMNNNDYYQIYGTDLLKEQQGMQGIQDYKNYYNDLNNLNIDELINSKNKNNINNNQNEFLRNIHEQSNSSINNNLQSSQRLNLNNNNNYFNEFDILGDNRLAQTTILPTTKYFVDANMNNKNNLNKINNNNIQQKNNKIINNNINNTEIKSGMKLSSSQQLNINQDYSLLNNKQNNLKNNDKNNLSHSLYDIRTGNNKINLTNTPNITGSFNNNNIINFNNNQLNEGKTININNSSNLSKSQYNNSTRINLDSNQYKLNSGTTINYSNRANNNNNQNNIGTRTLTTNTNRTSLDNNKYKVGTGTTVNNSRSNIAQNNYSLGTTNNNNNRINLTKSQHSLGTNINNNNNNNNNNLAQSYYSLGTSTNNNNNNIRINLAQSHYNLGENNYRQNLKNTQISTGNNNNNKTNIYYSQYSSGRNNKK